MPAAPAGQPTRGGRSRPSLRRQMVQAMDTRPHSADATTERLLLILALRSDRRPGPPRHPQFMRLYNTLTRREEDFAPSRDNQVRMYSCGLTVYARGHIGNFRTFVAVDVLRRALKYQEGFDVLHVMNFTDVDDRTILESNKAGVPLREYTDRYIAAFREDCGGARARDARAAAARHRRREHHGDGRDDRRARAARATRIRATDRSTSRSRRFPSTAGSRGSITPGSRAARGSTATSTRRTTPATSCCGRRASRGSRRGTPASAPAVPAGTSSARRWRCACWGRRSICTPAAST